MSETQIFFLLLYFELQSAFLSICLLDFKNLIPSEPSLFTH